MKRILALGAAVLAIAAAPQGANAQGMFYNICSPGAFKICASADVSLSPGGMVMRVWNMNIESGMNGYYDEFGGQHTITAVGLSNVTFTNKVKNASVSARLFTAAGTSRLLSSWGGSADANQIQIKGTGADASQGHYQGIVGCNDAGPVSKDHVSTCGTFPDYAYVEFTFTGITGLNLANAEFEFHGQQMVNGGSLKGIGGYNDVPPPPPPTQVVPEPVTSILLGSGLMGLAAARRRKKKAEEAANV